MHRWDAQAAAGTPQPLDAELTADGIDEYLDFADFALRRSPVEGLVGSMHLHAAGREWLLSLSPSGVTYARARGDADAAIRGQTSDVRLWLENRISADSPALDVVGDRRIIDSWRAIAL